MAADNTTRHWQPGTGPVAVVMNSLNEGYNMEAVRRNLAGWAQEVFLMSSYRQVDTVDITLEKQNRYTTAEAIIAHNKLPLADTPRLLGSAQQRRLWLKNNFYRLPFRYFLLFLYHWLLQGAWRAGWVGYALARSRSVVIRLIEYKRGEMEITGRLPVKRHYGPGQPDARVRQFE